MNTRDSKGRFTKGSIGNPKGRPKKKPEEPTADEVLNHASMEAVIRLIDLVHSQNEEIALHASIAVLDRVLGRRYINVPDGIKKMIMSWGGVDDTSINVGNTRILV